MKKLILIIFLLFYDASLFAQYKWISQNTGISSQVISVFAINSNTAWAVGSSGKIIHTTNSGNSWQIQNSGTSEQLRDVYFIDSDTGWVVGSGNPGFVLHTTNGGANWNIQMINNTNFLIDIEMFTME